MNIATWNRKLEQQRLDKFLRSSKKADKKLDPNCQHSFPDGMALAYLIPPFPLTDEEKLEMVKTCIKCKGVRETGKER